MVINLEIEYFLKVNRTVLILLISLFIINGCAGRSSTVAPANVSANEYSTLSCDETKALLSQKREQEIALSKKQNQGALVDTIGVALILVPVGSVFGSDHEGELAQAKGEVNALGRAIDINCK